MLSGRNALVTGASRGIGWELSKKLAQLGCAVTMVARNENLLIDNIKRLPKSDEQRHKYIPCDLLALARGLKPEIHALLAENLQNVSILVNCAGLTTYKLMPRLTTEEIVNVIDLNLLAPLLLSKMAISPMVKIGRQQKITPSILNISSLLSATGTAVAGTTAYAALKAGLLGLTESMAKEMNGKIRVNAVLPALVPETDMGKSATKSLPTVEMNDVIETCVRVLTDESLNGKFVAADGGDFRTLN